METKKYTDPAELEKYSFLWSEIRLIIAALALFIGGVPPIIAFSPVSVFGIAGFFLRLCWIISGAASAYLLYRWNVGGNTLFGGKKPKDTYAFFVMIISGLNLGIAGIFGKNIGMSISSNRVIFMILGILYLVSTSYLYKRWNENGKKVF